MDKNALLDLNNGWTFCFLKPVGQMLQNEFSLKKNNK